MRNKLLTGVFLALTMIGCSAPKNNNESILLKNGTVVDGYKQNTYRADVLIQDGSIAEIGDRLAADKHKVIDCTGLFITAGFVDSHVHVESSMVLPDAFGEAVLPQGTTAVIADPHEVVNVAGAQGLTDFLNEAKKAPIDIFTCVPSSVPATPYDTNGAGQLLAEEMKPFVDRPDIVGLAEVMCGYDVANRAPEIMDKITLFKNKTIDGHTAGLPASLLDSYFSAGIQNDHECSDTASMLKRYELGAHIYIREGSAARNAQALLQCVKEQGLDLSKFAFCTDDKHLATIEKEGHISFIARMARRMGFSWGEVARMASYNPCRFYKLENRGNVTKGYKADLVVTDDFCQHIAYVIKDGKLVAKDQKRIPPLHKAPARTNHPFENTVKFKELTAEDFILPDERKGLAIGLVDNQLLTTKVALKEGEWKQLPLLATIERYGKNGNLSVCPIKGYGIRGGAVATSFSHDSHNVVCAGDNATDMAVACNHLKKLGGGYVIAAGGKVVGELPLPAYGLMATTDAATTAAIIEELEKKAHSMGVNPNIDAFITLSFTALPVIPSLRLLDTGLFDVDKNKFVSASDRP